ncbi:hypothetical protein T492DRAFT_835465 [Pavlovales sp. CCMP2436]|nr:hypothetical protein T492DRAFT_835465 [Pavlovales sp. CCMP2436]
MGGLLVLGSQREQPKRPAADPPAAVTAATAKKSKPASTAVKPGAAAKPDATAKPGATAKPAVAWGKARTVPVPGASYQDQTLQFATLKDGRELLIGGGGGGGGGERWGWSVEPVARDREFNSEQLTVLPITATPTLAGVKTPYAILIRLLKTAKRPLVYNVWRLPPGACAASPAALKTLEKVGKMQGDTFAVLPGIDAAAETHGAVDLRTAAGRCVIVDGHLALCALPSSATLVADVHLPGSEPGCIKRLMAAPAEAGAVSLLVCTNKHMFVFTVRKAASGAFVTAHIG